MRLIKLFVLVALVGCGSSKTYMGERVVNTPFAIAGGKRQIVLPATNGGPIPAEDDRIKIQVAGFHISNAPIPKIRWTFAFTSKRPQTIEQVLIEELTEAEPLVVLRDNAPTLKGSDWSGSTDAMDAGPQSQPWLYSAKASIFVFRFTIKCTGEQPLVYHQPTWFAGSTKAMMIRSTGETGTR